LFISVPDAVGQAAVYGTTPSLELLRYVVHGVLHLRGYDDLEPGLRRVMKREENRLVRRLSERFPVDGLVGGAAGQGRGEG
jgi:probable rRNA maturation factor